MQTAWIFSGRKTPTNSSRQIKVFIFNVYIFHALMTKNGLFAIFFVRLRLSFTYLFNCFSSIFVFKCDRSYSSSTERTFFFSSVLVKPQLHAGIAKGVIAAIGFRLLCKVCHAYDTLLLLTLLGLLWETFSVALNFQFKFTYLFTFWTKIWMAVTINLSVAWLLLFVDIFRVVKV